MGVHLGSFRIGMIMNEVKATQCCGKVFFEFRAIVGKYIAEIERIRRKVLRQRSKNSLAAGEAWDLVIDLYKSFNTGTFAVFAIKK
jgi:hypothetical protein